MCRGREKCFTKSSGVKALGFYYKVYIVKVTGASVADATAQYSFDLFCKNCFGVIGQKFKLYCIIKKRFEFSLDRFWGDNISGSYVYC